MSVAIDHPTSPKTRSAVLAVFIAFTIFFLAYVDLYMVVDQQAFRPISRAFWNTFNLSYIAFFAVVIAVLLTAVMCTIGLVRSQGSDLYNKRSIPLTMAIVAVLSAGAWWLFLTVHGFGLSVLAVLSTFGIVLVAGVSAVRCRNVAIPSRYVVLPVVLTLLTMLAVVVLVLMSYVTLSGVAPSLFGANVVELVIVLGVMGVAILVASFFVARAMLMSR